MTTDSKNPRHVRAAGGFRVCSSEEEHPVPTPAPAQDQVPSVLEAALEYGAALGWEVFPARFKKTKEGKWQKFSWKSAKSSNGCNWGKTTNPDEICKDFAKRNRTAVGIATGIGSGIFVIETDTVEGGHDHDGSVALRELEAKYGKLPDTREAISPTGSRHRYYTHPGNGTWITSRAIAPGVDVKGDGGMVIAPPSVRPDVGAYRWLNALAIADLPAAWLELLIEKPKAKASFPSNLPPPDIKEVRAAVLAIKNGSRDKWVTVGLALYEVTDGSAEGLAIFHAFRNGGTGTAPKTRIGFGVPRISQPA
jgi:hypothetical protein